MRQSGLGFHLRLSAYWFAASFKWFILLQGLLAARVQEIVPGGQEAPAWGMVVGLGAIEAMIGPVVFGLWSDRVQTRIGRRKPFLLVGGLLTIAALFVLYGAQTLGTMIFGYFLLQVSDDIATAPYSALIPDLVPEEERGRASGVMGLLQQLAQVVAAAVALSLGGNLFAIFCSIALVNVVALAVNFWGVREKPLDFSPPPAPSPQSGDGVLETPHPLPPLPSEGARGVLESWLQPLRSADFRWVWLTRFFNALGFYTILFYLVFFLQRSLGMNANDAKSLQIKLGLLISVTSAVGAAVGGKFSDRIGRKKIIQVAGYVMFGALIPFALLTGQTVLYAVAAVFGLGYGAYLSADWALAADVMPSKKDLARDMGLWTMSVPLGQMVAGWVGSLLGGDHTLAPLPQYQVIFLGAAVFFLLSTVLVRLVRAST